MHAMGAGYRTFPSRTGSICINRRVRWIHGLPERMRRDCGYARG